MAELLFKDARDYLKFEYELRRARRSSYSMRAFARDLKVSPSGLNDFIKGRVGMSKARIQSVSKLLNWSESREEHFRDLILSKHESDAGARQAALLRVRSRLKEGSSGLSLDAFRAISEWYYMVIIEMCEIRDHLRVEEIADQLKLDGSLIQQALRRLKKLGLLKITEQGWKPVDGLSHFGDQSPSDAIVHFHSQILDQAKKALHERSMDEREIQALVFSMRSADVTKMNSEIKQAILGIVNRYAQAPACDNVQVFSWQSFGAANFSGK